MPSPKSLRCGRQSWKTASRREELVATLGLCSVAVPTAWSSVKSATTSTTSFSMPLACGAWKRRLSYTSYSCFTASECAPCVVAPVRRPWQRATWAGKAPHTRSSHGRAACGKFVRLSLARPLPPSLSRSPRHLCLCLQPRRGRARLLKVPTAAWRRRPRAAHGRAARAHLVGQHLAHATVSSASAPRPPPLSSPFRFPDLPSASKALYSVYRAPL